MALVNSIMARDCFELLLTFWHFSNNETAAEGDKTLQTTVNFPSPSAASPECFNTGQRVID